VDLNSGIDYRTTSNAGLAPVKTFLSPDSPEARAELDAIFEKLAHARRVTANPHKLRILVWVGQ
jgi:predicted ATPase